MGTITAQKKRQALWTLPMARLRELTDAFELEVADRRIRDEFIFTLADGRRLDFGLLLQELLLRQRVEYTLIICPAAVCLQCGGMRCRSGSACTSRS